MKKSHLLASLLSAIATTSLLSAQHQVTINGSWVHNGTLFKLPQLNIATDTDIGGSAIAVASADYFGAGVSGNASMSANNTVVAATRACGQALGSYTYTGPLNGAIFLSGNTSTQGFATAAGNTAGSNFDISASYQNSLGFAENAGSVWPGAGPVLMTVPSSFSTGGIVVATSYSWSSSSLCSVRTGARGAGSSVNLGGRAGISSQTTLF